MNFFFAVWYRRNGKNFAKAEKYSGCDNLAHLFGTDRGVCAVNACKTLKEARSVADFSVIRRFAGNVITFYPAAIAAG